MTRAARQLHACYSNLHQRVAHLTLTRLTPRDQWIEHFSLTADVQGGDVGSAVLTRVLPPIATSDPSDSTSCAEAGPPASTSARDPPSTPRTVSTSS
jgi:hypothetical protein